MFGAVPVSEPLKTECPAAIVPRVVGPALALTVIGCRSCKDRWSPARCVAAGVASPMRHLTGPGLPKTPAPPPGAWPPAISVP